MKKRLSILQSLLFFLLISGCAGAPYLVPAPSLQTTGDTAQKSIENVFVSVSGNAWKGRDQVKDHVTPLLLTIKNEHKAPLKISYNLFSLTDPTGGILSALPPFSIKGAIEEPEMYSSFTCPGFYVAPYYMSYYPYMHGYNDPFYYDYYCTRWREIALPTREMLDLAIPEGVLESGAKVSGFLYFEKIGDEQQYNFEMKLVEAKTGRRFGTINIPFVKKQ